MKNILISLIITTVFLTETRSQWISQNTGLEWLNAAWISVVDQNTVYFGADCGGYCTKIFRTTNGGVDWSQRFSNSPSDPRPRGGGRFFSNEMGYVAIDDHIMKSTDGGQSWSSVYQSPAPFRPPIGSLVMVDENLGYAMFYNGGIPAYVVVKTTNGTSWNQVFQSTTTEWKSFNKATFVNANTGFVLGYFGNLYKTATGGASWSTVTVPEEGWGMTAVSEQTLIVHTSATVYYSTNGGISWTPSTPGIQNGAFITGIHFFDADTGWLVTNNGIIHKTTDRGTTWGLQAQPTVSTLRQIGFYNAQIGWAIGSNGTNLATTNGGGSPIVASVTPGHYIAEHHALYQNHPNPFNPSTTITYDLPTSSHVTLTVYDVLGREVATLVDGEESAGTKSVNLNAGDIASGVYYYRLQASGFSQTRKMLIVK